MTNELRKLTDGEVKEIFAHTSKTHDFKIEKIEYVHYEDFSDFYRVFTDKGIYKYQKAEKMKHKTAFTNNRIDYYDRIVKLKK